MRLPTLFFSVLVHGGAIGALAAVGAYANQVRLTPHVEIQSSDASMPAAEQVLTRFDIVPDVVPEASPMAAELPPDPVVPDGELHRDVLDDEVVTESEARPELKAWLTRIKADASSSETAESALVEPVEEVVPPPVAEVPASVHTAASPRADNRAPPYPEHERVLGREGIVLVTVTVDQHGLVIRATLAKASRYAGFNRVALAAVRKWRFLPGTVDGAPIEDEVDVPVVFRLSDLRK